MQRGLIVGFVLLVVDWAAAADLKTAPGFELTRVHAVAREAEGSWVSLAADDRGRLYASDQYGPLYRVTPAADPAAAATATKLPLPIGGVHGMAWINGSLYAVAGQKSVCATGLYRLRDTDADGELDHVELLQALDGDGEHGPHAVVAAPDGRSLFVLAGNATRLPPLARSRMPKLWADDSLLAPLPALMGSETRGLLPGGWICRTDLEGKTWELWCAGFRNAYALAFDRHGELFTFDSDTEFEINLPWYRPTRVVHAVSGADFGWRRGALKVPAHAPDLWPTLLPMGLGSPTAVLAPTTAKLPAAYRDALWVADWSYGKIWALHLEPNGATFTARREEIVAGMPLPVTAMCVNPKDGAVYFTTGGRRQQSAVHRLRWTGEAAAEERRAVKPTPDAKARHRLEDLAGSRTSDAAWPSLASPDPHVRRAARTTLENQPPAEWRERALAEKAPRPALAALLALARADAAASHREILAALRRLHDEPLSADLRGEWLRVLALTFARAGDVAPEIRAPWAPVLERLFPLGRHEDDAALLELLVFCEAPQAAAHGMTALRSAATREAQIELAKSLRVLRSGWTPALRRDFFAWLGATNSWRGGASYGRFLQKLRDDAIAALPEPERAEWRDFLAAAAKTAARPEEALSLRQTVVREWTTDDLTALAQGDTRKRDAAHGRKLFAATGCFACHAFGGEGGALGPDLTAVTRRLSVHDLFEAIVEPSREISDQYNTSLVRTRDGRQLSGRIVNLTENGLQLAENLADPSNLVRLAEAVVVSIEASKHSLMPPGLLNVLSAEEILDLLAFLRSGGEAAR